MGRVRSEKKARRSKPKAAKSPPTKPSTEQLPAVSSSRSTMSMEVQSVVPLPKEVMEGRPTLSLESTHKPLNRTTMKKKHRQKQRHEMWINKVNVFKRAQEKAKAAEERQKTVVVGDIHPLIDALPDIGVEISEKKSKTSIASRRPQIMKEMDHFHEVLKHPAFVEDPLKTISLHIQNSIARGLT